MPNNYIDIYEQSKTQSSILNSVLMAFTELKGDLSKQDDEKPIDQLTKARSLIGFFEESPLRPEKNERKLEIIEAVLNELSSLSIEQEGAEAEPEDINTRKAIVAVLEKYIHELSDTEKTIEFLNFVLNDIISYDFTTRQSRLIDSNDGNNDKDNPWYSIDIGKLLKQKGLDSTIFAESKLSSDHPIAEHVAWAYAQIYQHSYPGSYIEKHNIARFHHGIQHVTRAATYARVFANLYRKHGDVEAASLTEEDIQLIEIAIIFHDSAREDDGEDFWDHESAILLYHYLSNIGVDPEKAKQIAEATANKDPSRNGYFELREDDHGVFWRFKPVAESWKKNIFQKIIHDCDCLDIIRARNQFDSQYLDFYKEIAMHPGNELALEEMAQVVMEARSIIDTQGDLQFRIDAVKKKRYEHGDAYTAITEDINPVDHNIIAALNTRLFSVEELHEMQLIDLTPYDKEKELTEHNLAAALREGQIFVRGIATPSASSRKNQSELAAELEIRKIMREAGVPTRIGRTDKKANKFRSVSVLGYGSSVYSSAGLVIFNPELSSIKKIALHDFHSSRGKKAFWQFSSQQSKEETKKEYEQLLGKMKIGGIGLPQEVASNYVEILYDVSKVQAIYFTPDPTVANDITCKNYEPTHPHSPLLQAIYIQKAYENQYKNIHADFVRALGEKEGESQFTERFGRSPILPVYEYSGLHNRMVAVDQGLFTDEYIISLWVEMCSDYIKKGLDHRNDSVIYAMNVNDIKILAMYGREDNGIFQFNMAGDSSYPEHLKERITQAITIEKQRLIVDHEEQLLALIRGNPELILSDKILTELFYSENLRNNAAELIAESFTSYVSQLHKPLSALHDAAKNSDFNKLDQNPSSQLLNNSLFKVYNISKKLKLEHVTQVIQQRAIEYADEKISSLHISSWNEKTTPYDIYRNIVSAVAVWNLTKQLECSDRIEKNLKSRLAALIRELAHCFAVRVYKKGTISEYNSVKLSYDELRDNGLLSEGGNQWFLESFNQGRENLALYKGQSFGTDEIITHISLALLLKQDFIDDLAIWINANPYCRNNVYQRLIEKLQNNSIEIDDRLFNLLIELTFHLTPIYSTYTTELISREDWIEYITLTESLMEGELFSETQWKVINQKFSDHISRTIKDEIRQCTNRASMNLEWSPEKIQVSVISLIGTQISELLSFQSEQFKLEIPEVLIKEFNEHLNKLSELLTSESEFRIDETAFAKIMRLHQHLPHQETRAEVIDMLNNFQTRPNEINTNRNAMRS